MDIQRNIKNNIEIYNLVSIDPGRNFGICVSELQLNYNNLTQWKFKVIDTKTILINPIVYFNMEDMSLISSKSANMILFKHIFTDYLNKISYTYDIDIKNYKTIFISEDIFLNKRFIRTYGSLVNFITELEKIIVLEYNKILYKIPPRLIKKTFSHYGNSSKSIMKKIVTKNYKKLGISKSKLKSMSEHEIDAIAVGYSYCVLTLNNISMRR